MTRTEAELGELVARALSLEAAAAADPETEPHRSRYAARELLSQAAAALEDAEAEAEAAAADDELRRLRLAWLRVRLASNHLETEEAAEAHRLLTRLAAEIFPGGDGDEDEQPERLFRWASVRLQLLNWIGCAACHLGRHSEAIGQLKRAEAVYLRCRRLLEGAADVGASVVVWGLAELFPVAAAASETDRDRQWSLDSAHTRTLFYLAQACGKADQPAESARYCQLTLGRQLALADYTASEWSLNCAALSQYHLGLRDFPRAHRCLCAASAVFAEAAAANPEAMSSHDPDSELQHNEASIRRCWVKYALALLEYSRDLLHGQEQQRESDLEYEDLFPTVDASQHADKIDYRPAVNFDQARPIFLFAQRQLGLAKEFFRLDEHCSDHVELVRDHSRAFLHLAQFELDGERRARMHKRRADMLRQLLDQLSQQFYLLVCRQLRFELGETLVDMLDIKLAAMESSSGSPTAAAVAKANQLGRDAVAQFAKFVDSFRSPAPESALPERLEAMDERPVLLALFHSGRLAARLLESSRERRLANLRQSEASYRRVAEYCDRWPEAAAKMAPELGLIREMLVLMPVKIQSAMEKFS